MLNSVSVAEQYARAGEDDLRILIIGAGIAGVTAAQLFRREGRHPVLIERNMNEGHPGYMLALMPMADQAIAELGVRELYRANSMPFDRYRLHGHTGRLLRTDSMESLLSHYGDYRGIGRGELIETLAADGCDVSYGTTVTALTDSSGSTTATLTTAEGTEEREFDLVIVADGIHSTTRSLLLGDQPVGAVDTTWGGWVVWAPQDTEMNFGDELWGDGFFLGVYPVKGRLGVFLGGPNDDSRIGPALFVDRVRRRLATLNPRIESALRAVAETPDPYYWPLDDTRAPLWTRNRAVLLGDAAAGFLPTAGIGAGMAMESAWVLAHVVRDAHPAHVPPLLRAYEKAQRPRVEAAQNNSRSLAKMMFHRSTTLAMLRELAMRIVSVKVALKPIQTLLATSLNPDAIAAVVTAANEPIDAERAKP